MSSRHQGDRLLFRAGSGEWYNQPHDRRWDMGEDAAEIPPAGWHVALRRTLEAAQVFPQEFVVDVRQMIWLVGQDWGFLLRLTEELEPRSCRLVVLATPHVAKASGHLGIEERMTVVASLDALPPS